MRVALPVWAGRIAPVFEVARTFVLADVAAGRVTTWRAVPVDAGDPPGKLAVIAALGAGTLVCGGVTEETCGLALAYGLAVIPFVAGDIDEVLTAFARGGLPAPELTMPGCWPVRRLREDHPGPRRTRKT